ncbi:hypothetical protein J6590_094220 [Homalodisca vitripennis]|nr:hypothetical protein J6590_094220 [Homalodisca vitripennis]
MEINMTQTETGPGAPKYENIKRKFVVSETWTVAKWKSMTQTETGPGAPKYENIKRKQRLDLEHTNMKVSNTSMWCVRPGLSPNGNQYDTDRAWTWNNNIFIDL